MRFLHYSQEDYSGKQFSVFEKARAKCGSNPTYAHNLYIVCIDIE